MNQNFRNVVNTLERHKAIKNHTIVSTHVYTRCLTTCTQGKRKGKFQIQVHVPNIISDNAFSGLVKVHLEKSLKLRGSLKVHLEKSLKLLPLREGP